MTRSFALAAVVALAGAAVPEAQRQALSPVGVYSVTTATDSGQPLAGTLQVTATPAGYGGTFTSPALPAPLKVAGVTTNQSHLMATIDNGSNGLVLVWIELAADGTFKGTWHQLSPGIATTGKKEK